MASVQISDFESMQTAFENAGIEAEVLDLDDEKFISLTEIGHVYKFDASGSLVSVE